MGLIHLERTSRTELGSERRHPGKWPTTYLLTREGDSWIMHGISGDDVEDSAILIRGGPEGG